MRGAFSLVIIFFALQSVVALQEVDVDYDEEEERLVLMVQGPIVEDSTSVEAHPRQRRLRRDQVVLDSSRATGQPGQHSWWTRAYTYLSQDSSWLQPTMQTSLQSQAGTTATASTTSTIDSYPQSQPQVYYYQPPPETAAAQPRSYTPFTTPQRPPPQFNYSPPSYYTPSSQVRSGTSNTNAVTLSRVVSHSDTLLDKSSPQRHPYTYMNPDYPSCWPHGDTPLDLYSTSTCCFLCRSGHNPTKPTRGVVVGANAHGLEFTGTCTGLHEHMRQKLHMTMGDTMCKITQMTFAEYCCAGELEVATNWGTWTVK